MKKRKNAAYQNFSIFPQCFASMLNENSSFGRNFIRRLQRLSIFDKSKTLSFSTKLTEHELIIVLLTLLPNDKFFDCSKLKAFADDKINVTEKRKFSVEWI